MRVMRGNRGTGRAGDAGVGGLIRLGKEAMAAG